MNKFFYKHTLAAAILFSFCLASAQKKYDFETKPSTLTLEGKTLSGYQTNFDFGRDDVRRGWWSYARKFSAPLNMKTYYKVTVPSEITDGNVDLEIFSQTSDGKSGGTGFFLGVEKEQYKEQAQSLLIDFKRTFYINDLTEKMNERMAQSNELGRKYEDAILASEKEEFLSGIVALGLEIKVLKRQLKDVLK